MKRSFALAVLLLCIISYMGAVMASTLATSSQAVTSDGPSTDIQKYHSYCGKSGNTNGFTACSLNCILHGRIGGHCIDSETCVCEDQRI